MKLSKYEKIFLRIVKAYVRKYKDHSFRFYFDDYRHHFIGTSKTIIEVKFAPSKEVFKRIFTEGSLGLGEAYCNGWIKVDDQFYKYFILIFIRTVYNLKLLLSLPPTDILYILRARFKRKFFSKNNKAENINAHYSLSEWFEREEDANRFYLWWLDSRYIQYSCGKWDEHIKTLEEAQVNKLRFYAERLGIDRNSRGKTLIDLGCGWGGCLFFMAENYGIRCKGVTLSTAQAKYIHEEIRQRNLGDLVSVEVEDIHNVKGAYDYVISIGVMEHISDYDHLYKNIAGMLNKNGAALIHSIFHTELFYKVDPFMTKYIFPGGSTPEINRNLKIFRKYFNSVDRNDLPPDSYAKTLACWYNNFCKNENHIRKLLIEKSKVKDVDFAVRVFKHYLTLACCGFSDHLGLVSNILVKNPVPEEMAPRRRPVRQQSASTFEDSVSAV